MRKIGQATSVHPELVDHGQLLVYGGAPHVIHLTRRADLNADLRAFVAGPAFRAA